MSSLLFKSVITPANSKGALKTYDSYATPFSLENVAEFTEEEMKSLINPDPKAARSMSRTALLMTDVGMKTQAAIDATIKKNAFRVAMYAVLDNGPDDYKSVFSTADLNDAEFPQAYKKSRSPKQYLKQLPNVAPAQLGIFLGVMGSTNVYVNTQHGVLQALDQAEADLANDVADIAMVISAYSLEDALLSRRTQMLGQPGLVMSEGAACLILAPGAMTDWRSKIRSLKNSQSYGISTPLINLIKEGLV